MLGRWWLVCGASARAGSQGPVGYLAPPFVCREERWARAKSGLMPFFIPSVTLPEEQCRGRVWKSETWEDPESATGREVMGLTA